MAASDWDLVPLTSTSNRERIRVSRKKSPSAASGGHVAGAPADGEGRFVDQGHHAGSGVELGDRAGKVPGVGHAVTVPADLVTTVRRIPRPGAPAYSSYTRRRKSPMRLGLVVPT